MFSSRNVALGSALLAITLGSGVLNQVAGQQTANPAKEKPAVGPGTAASHEFPVVMRQKVVAGKTPIGTKIQAQLLVATLVAGVVVPRDAILSGEVTESVGKTDTDPSRLAICLDSAEWKGGSTPLKVYLTPWYYPLAPMTSQNVSYQPIDQANSTRNWNGMGTYPDPGNPVAQQKFPARDSDHDAGLTTPSPSSSISTRRVLMKNIEPTRNDAGAITLTSKNSTIKLDKVTTYVFASGDLVSITSGPAK